MQICAEIDQIQVGTNLSIFYPQLMVLNWRFLLSPRAPTTAFASSSSQLYNLFSRPLTISTIIIIKKDGWCWVRAAMLDSWSNVTSSAYWEIYTSWMTWKSSQYLTKFEAAPSARKMEDVVVCWTIRLRHHNDSLYVMLRLSMRFCSPANASWTTWWWSR